MAYLPDPTKSSASIVSPEGAGRPLCAVAPCTRCVVASMGATDPNRVRYLAALGLMPQSCLTVEGRAPFGGPVLVVVGSARYAVGREAAEQILVVPAEALEGPKASPAVVV